MKKKSLGFLACVGFAALLYRAPSALAQVAPNLLTAGSFSVLAGSQVTSTGGTTITGDVGISPGAGVAGSNHPGLTPAMVGGVIHDADAIALQAMTDKDAAYTALDLNNACGTTYPGAFQDLAGLTLVPGVYCATQFRLTGTLTLSGLASDTWVFKSASDLIISGGTAANVVSPSCSVWWRVVSTATFDAGSSLIGNILADTSITMAAGATLSGRALARTAAVTLSSNNVVSTCGLAAPTPTPGGPTPTPGGPTPTPGGPTLTPTPGGIRVPPVPMLEPSALALLAIALAAVAFLVLRRNL